MGAGAQFPLVPPLLFIHSRAPAHGWHSPHSERISPLQVAQSRKSLTDTSEGGSKSSQFDKVNHHTGC